MFLFCRISIFQLKTVAVGKLLTRSPPIPESAVSMLLWSGVKVTGARKAPSAMPSYTLKKVTVTERKMH